ncbi:MAG: nicotinamide riboside transporter PnuC [Acidipropionibacterium acidipropionici]|jgi:nicotinamide mononucleotide transporter|uniref:Nicotinamide riboside transporter PnuC n=2 Tax=Acidipropionibacterium acidipropionici TaxID=1748 RepID=A0AAC8YDP3_9ACTN|nr:nicotinamide riboside transporter PnuC [Acidipropionibacterium acidipropionici]AFV89888.1 Nicotinamide mononucleotide transporter [Acidipropionibacterium acidipropionici ATCC 4875]AMS04747.1 hypothetical protein AXH35_03880 [Acidipropionibacterium acidipropionici]AOZ46237.1 hypothetical protein A8L58_05345 [Acidipropionibacterium acidipropionici]AZP37736.1 nicotinamide riboside transporter PnuC [Acidipropionibacterium acidipropionici]MDN6556417.1 nicotinamide riboside transporter PnuC [Acid
MGDVIMRFLNAQLDIGLGRPVLWREIIGNIFGLASALGGARRRIWAWPVGIVGNVLLFTVFLGGVFHTPQDLNLWGQAGRQVFFLITSAYGWVQWAAYRRSHRSSGGAAVAPRWATPKERMATAAAAVVMLIVFYIVLKALGSWGPASDSWILTGSILATFGMARGWNEFWFIWIAVDLVGVPLLLSAHYYPSGLMYIFYGGFCLYGFFTWWRLRDQDRSVDIP